MKAIKIVNKHFPQVTKVIDGKTKQRIEVTPTDVRSSETKKHNGCAMAVACKRSMDLDGVLISVRAAYLIKGNKAIRYRVPENVTREIVSFDRNAGFAPGKYQLVPFSPSLRLGSDNGSHSPASGARKTVPRFYRHTEGIRAALR